MHGVAAWFAARGEVPLLAPPRFRGYGPLADDPDLPDADFSADEIRGVSFGLEYCDSRGWVSTRTIRCLGLDPTAPARLKAFCNVRGTTRTFRLDRIVSLVDLRTGGILTGEAHRQLLAPYLPEQEADAFGQAMRDLHAATRDGVLALLHLAMPEGRLGDHAREIVLDYIEAEAGAAACPLPPVRAVELWIDNLSPPADAVTDAVVRLAWDKDRLVRLLPSILSIVRTHRSLIQEEALRGLLREIRKHHRRQVLEQPFPLRAVR